MKKKKRWGGVAPIFPQNMPSLPPHFSFCVLPTPEVQIIFSSMGKKNWNSILFGLGNPFDVLEVQRIFNLPVEGRCDSKEHVFFSGA